jgi:hypothetical protein
VPIQPRISSESLYGPSISIHGNQEEYHYFQTFTEFAARELPGYFTTDFWSRIVSQESHAVAPIRYAAIAIGALKRSLESASEPDLKVNIIQNVNKRHHEYAVLHYLKAVQTLNKYLSTSESPQMRIALISCLLFVCFETFQGSFASTARQSYGGLTILRSYCAGNPKSSSRTPQRALPQRALPPQGSLRYRSAQVMKTLQIRQGGGNTSKARDIAVQTEKYPETENNPGFDWKDVVSHKDKAPETLPIEPFIFCPYVGKVDIPMTGAVLQQVRADGVPIKDSALHPSVSAGNQSIQTGTTALRKASSVSSNSTVSTPVPYVPPEATGSRRSSSVSTSQLPLSSRKFPTDSRSPTPPILQSDLTIEDSLIQMFARLDCSGEFFGLPPLIPPMVWDIHKAHHLPIPPSFANFSSAQRSWDFLMDEALQFYRRTFFNKVFAPASSDSPTKIAKQYALYMQKFAAFEKAFQPILNASIDGDGTVSNPAALVLSLYQKLTLAILATVHNPSEMVYDSYLPEFQYITTTCARVIRSQGNAGTPKNIRFSFEIGVIPPLHFTAMKCRDPIIRREAIKLLFSSPRQEGMWDSVLCGRIGTWLTSCEEDGLSPPPLASKQSNLYISPNESEEEGPFDHSGPQLAVDKTEPPGGWEDGKRLSEVITRIVGGHLTDDMSDEAEGTAEGPNPNPNLLKRRPVFLKGWRVPEENRVQLTVVEFHIPERHIKFKCRSMLVREDGSREERETVISW